MTKTEKALLTVLSLLRIFGITDLEFPIGSFLVKVSISSVPSGTSTPAALLPGQSTYVAMDLEALRNHFE